MFQRLSLCLAQSESVRMRHARQLNGGKVTASPKAICSTTMWKWILGFYALMSVATYIVYAWDNQLGYALALLDDLTDEQFVLRPGGKMNHPAWIVGHIAAYHPVIGQLLRGELVVPESVPSVVRALVSRLLRKNPKERPGDWREVVALLTPLS